MADHAEKTLDPTPHRRQQARDQGRFARSPDLNAAGLLLGGLAALLVTGGRLVEFLAGLMIDHLSGKAWIDHVGANETYSSAALVEQWSSLAGGLAVAVVPLLSLALAAGVAMPLVQSGLRFRAQGLAIDFARVNPAAGLARVWSFGSVARLAFGLLKIAAIAAIAFWCLSGRGDEMASVSAMSVAEIARYAWETCLWTCMKIALGLSGLAAFDYALARWRFERELKMTPEEMREELRNSQGDPQVVARRKVEQRKLSEGRVSEAVRHADLVVSQPGGAAVALSYDAATMTAPIVVARGKGSAAVNIAKIAAERGIAVVERGPLANRLFRETLLNAPIPAPLYGAVAEVMSLSRATRQKSAA